MSPTRSAVAAIFALVVLTTSVLALESSRVGKSSLSAQVLWQVVGDFCGVTRWHPLVEECALSGDGKVRTLSLLGGGVVVEALENWDAANRSYAYTSASPLPVANYHSKIRVIADGKGSALQLTATYEAKGASDADATQAVERAIFRALCVSGPLQCNHRFGSVEVVEIPDTFSTLTLQAYLRRPEQTARSPAVILLHGCFGQADQLDESWAERIASWGYVTLTIDSFGRRGLKTTCRGGAPSDADYDPYRGLNYLIRQKLVDSNRVAIVGFGGSLALWAAAPGAAGQMSETKFRAAAAFYPPCGAVKGPMMVPTLILIGELDDWATPEACRKLAEGSDDLGISRKREGAAIQLVVYPNAYTAFDIPALQKPIQYLGHRLQYNQTAAEQSIEALREFLHSNIGKRL